MSPPSDHKTAQPPGAAGAGHQDTGASQASGPSGTHAAVPPSGPRPSTASNPALSPPGATAPAWKNPALSVGATGVSGVNPALKAGPSGISGQHPQVNPAAKNPGMHAGPTAITGKNPPVLTPPSAVTGKNPALAPASTGVSGKNPPIALGPSSGTGKNPAVVPGGTAVTSKNPAFAIGSGGATGQAAALAPTSTAATAKHPAHQPAAGASGPSNRIDDRLPANLVVTFRVPGRAAFIERYAANISKGGIFIVSREVHPVGSEIGFEIRSVDGAVCFSGRGVVRWTRMHDAATKQLPGLGIQFTELDDENKATLAKILAAQASSLAEQDQQLMSLSSPAEAAAELHKAHVEAVTETVALPKIVWPASVPSIMDAREIVQGKMEPSLSVKPFSDAFMAELPVDERGALAGKWPALTGQRFREVLATQWRLSVALKSRPAAGTPTDSAALDQLFADADDALKQLKELSDSVVPEVKSACATARDNIARTVQELLPTSDEAAIAHDQAAAEVLKQQRLATQRLATAQAAAPKVQFEEPKAEKPSFLKRVGPRIAFVLFVLSVFAMGFTIWTQLIPPSVKEVPALEGLPAGTRVLGNPESGQVILQSAGEKPFTEEALAHIKQKAAGKGLTISRLSQTQILVSTQP